MIKKLLILLILLLVTTPTFAQSVDTAWVRRYNGPGTGSDSASAIATDEHGYVYVTGGSEGIGSSRDYATIKYSSMGDTVWVKTYNGPGNGADYASAIAIDDSGNVYVTGFSYGGGSYWDYATIKYRANGDTAWVRRYNGPGNYSDCARALVVDDLGNVYVTGYCHVNGTDYDYTTVKYCSNGDTAWVRRYSGPGYDNDDAYDIALDNSGNVYVTGTSYNAGSGYDYATIKYSPSGDEVWVKRYSGSDSYGDYAHAITVDNSGNVYVTGGSKLGDTIDCYATIKYYPNGDTAWSRRYGGPGKKADLAEAIAVDNSGNVYVTGKSADNTWLSHDYATVKYYSNGDTAWARRYSYPQGHYFEDQAWDLGIDVSGNVYVTGISYASTGEPYVSYDYATLKYNPNGDCIWVRRYNGSGNDFDLCFAMAVDASGNVCVTGQSWGGSTNFDYATIKYVQFLRGDVNNDAGVGLGDAIYLVSYLFRGGPPPNPIQAGDTNCDGKVSIGDVIYLINYLFRGGPQPCI